MKNKLLNISLILLCLSNYSCNLNCDSLTGNLNKNVLGKKCDLKDDSGTSFSLNPSSGSSSAIPINSWLTQLGASTITPGGDSSGTDLCYGVTVDSSGNVYCGGSTSGSLGETNGGGDDAFIMKLDSSGNLQWVTQLGATTTSTGGNNLGDDYCLSISVDSSGNVYCAGNTDGALGETNGGDFDAFVMKLDSSGNLQWVTQLGALTDDPDFSSDTSGTDSCNGVSVDSSGNVYCAGNTTGALGEANGGGGNQDAFVMKLDSSGNLRWITQLGYLTESPDYSSVTSGTETCDGVSVDSSGNVYCAGHTSLSLGEDNGGNYDAFVMKLDSLGNIQWVTQLGNSTVAPGGNNSNYDRCSGVNVDSSGNVYCAGYTQGSIGETNAGSTDAFVMKLNSSGTLQWVTQLGTTTSTPGGDTSLSDSCLGVSVDNLGNIYCAGQTGGSIGEANGGNYDVFTMKLNSSGGIQWVRQLGSTTETPGGDSSNTDSCSSVTVDTSGNVYCGGSTFGALGETNGGAGSRDAFIMKLEPDGSFNP